MKWHEQYDRVRRFLKLIQSHPRRIGENEEEYGDFVLAFFQNCWHLKDWIKNDPQVAQVQADKIDQLVDDRSEHDFQALQVCADIANASKHLQRDAPTHFNAPKRKLRRSPRRNGRMSNRAYDAKLNDSLATGESESSPVTWDFVVDYSEPDGVTEQGKPQRKEALIVAQEAMQNWDDIIATIGLLKSDT